MHQNNEKNRQYRLWLMTLMMSFMLSTWLVVQLWLEHNWWLYAALLIWVFTISQIRRIMKKTKDLNNK